MQDIADQVGVSKALVSLVFRKAPGPSDETASAGARRRRELGYRVNRTAALMTARRSHLIGVMADIRNSFHAEMVEDIVAAADRAGYEVVLGAVTPTHGESKVIDTLLDFRCEGSSCSAPSSRRHDSPSSADGAGGRRRPPRVCRHRRRRPHRGRARYRPVVDHLVELGHRRISHLSGGSGTIPPTAIRLPAAMRGTGLDGIDVIDGDFTERQAWSPRATPAPRRRPTAVCAANDRSAIGLFDELRRAGSTFPARSLWPATTTACWLGSRTST